jgi:hypothetical protein
MTEFPIRNLERFDVEAAAEGTAGQRDVVGAGARELSCCVAKTDDETVRGLVCQYYGRHVAAS